VNKSYLELTDKNKEKLTDNIIMLTELIIWGEKNDEDFFEYIFFKLLHVFIQKSKRQIYSFFFYF
jgi:hypothetical protein